MTPKSLFGGESDHWLKDKDVTVVVQHEFLHTIMVTFYEDDVSSCRPRVSDYFLTM
jgi:hypothetical protein